MMVNLQGIREIIIITARNRAGVYFDKGLGNISEEIHNRVYEQYLASYLNYAVNDYTVIDTIEKLFEEIEQEYINVQLKCKQEYGM